jgi:hypothetical protein
MAVSSSKRNERRSCAANQRDQAKINIANNAELHTNAQYILTMICALRLKNTVLVY